MDNCQCSRDDTHGSCVCVRCLVVSDPLQSHGLKHARLTCLSPTPGVYSNSCPLRWWCHPTISSSVKPFSSCLQSFPASGSFQMSQFFASGGQSVGVSASASILPMNIQDWFPLGWTDPLAVQRTLKSLLFKNINSSALSFVCSPTLTSIHDYWKNQRFDYMDLCWQKVLSLGVTKALHPNIATANSWVSDPQIWPSSRAP